MSKVHSILVLILSSAITFNSAIAAPSKVCERTAKKLKLLLGEGLPRMGIASSVRFQNSDSGGDATGKIILRVYDFAANARLALAADAFTEEEKDCVVGGQLGTVLEKGKEILNQLDSIPLEIDRSAENTSSSSISTPKSSTQSNARGEY